MSQKQTSNLPKQQNNKKINPCRRMHLDFQLCVKKQGFNDRQCKYYLDKYQSCIKKTNNI